MLGPAVVVDIESVGFAENGFHRCITPFENQRCDFTGGTIGTVDDEFHPGERGTSGKAILQELTIALLGTIDIMNRTDAFDCCAFFVKWHRVFNQLRYGTFGLIGELVSVAIEQLDTVVVIGIVGGGDHYTGIKSILCR